MIKIFFISSVLFFISMSCSTYRNNYDKNFLLSRNTYKVWYDIDRRHGVIFYDTTKTISLFDDNYFLIPLRNVDGIFYNIDADTIFFRYRPFLEERMVYEKFVVLHLSSDYLSLYNEKYGTISLFTYAIQDTLPLTNPEFSNDYIKPQPLFSDSDVTSLLESIDVEKKKLWNYRLVLYIDQKGSIEDAMILNNNKATLPSTMEEQVLITAIRKNLRYKAALDKRTGRNYSTKVLFEMKRYK